MHMSGRERIGYAAIGGLLLFGFGFIGARHLRKPAPITVQNTSAVLAPQVTKAQQVMSPPEDVVVHVAGAVRHPGVVRLSPGSRVVDAVHAAGGPLTNADLDSVNLAAKLVDGSQLRILTQAAVRTAVGKSKASRPRPIAAAIDKGGYFAPLTVAPEYLPKPTITPAAEPGKSEPTAAPGGEVSLNSADLAALDSLPGIGPSTAQKILDYRKEHGSFTSIDELLAVKGIGSKKLEKMRARLRL